MLLLGTNVTVVTPLMNLAPVSVTLSAVPLFEFVGTMDESTGAGFVTENAFASVSLPPPGATLVTVTARRSNGALTSILIYAATCDASSTTAESTVIPGPLKATDVTPLKKYDPVN